MCFHARRTLSSCLLRIRAILFFSNSLFRKGLSHAYYSVSSRQTSELSIKAWRNESPRIKAISRLRKQRMSFPSMPKISQGKSKTRKIWNSFSHLHASEKHYCHWFLLLALVPPTRRMGACCQMNWKVQKVPCNSLYCFPARRMLAHGQHRCHCWLPHWHQCSSRPSPLLHSCHRRSRAKF